MKTVIIGGVAGGASAAARLRRLDEAAEIVLLERGEYISYANCGLPYYIGGEITDRSALTLQTPESFHARFRVDVRTGNEAVSIDTAAKTVRVRRAADGTEYEESYDRLLLSPGAAPVRPPIEGLDSERVFTLRNIPDTYQIREFLEQKKPKTAVVAGGGAIGCEMAENLTRAGLSVTIVELADHIIAPLDYDMACLAQQHLRAKGVGLLLKNGIKKILPDGESLRVVLSEGELSADMLLLSAGVRPDTALAQAAGIRTSARGAIVVDERMRTSAPDVYAVGDAVEITDFVTGQKGSVPLAGPANKQGRIAADNIAGIPSRYHGTQGSSILKLFDLTVATTGLNERAAKAAGMPYDKIVLFSASHAGYYPGGGNLTTKVLYETGTGRILGAQIVGTDGVDKRCDVLAAAVRGHLSAIDLTELELCYAPPYSSAKDPVNMAGYVIDNLMTGKVRQFHWDEVAALPRDGSAVLIDTRTPSEYAAGHIEGFVNIPLDELRNRLDEIERGKPVYVNCQSALRSYIACRILSQNGFDCSHLSGGWRFYDAVVRESGYDGRPAHPCGIVR